MPHNPEVCVKHMKWAPCLIKSDLEPDCNVIRHANAVNVIHCWHNGTMLRSEVEVEIKKNFKVIVDWGV